MSGQEDKEGVVIDSHFAEPGRIGRLLGALGRNPRNIGLGIDEDTTVVVSGQEHLRVIGSRAVYAERKGILQRADHVGSRQGGGA